MDKLPFIPGKIYNRRADIHTLYGGNWQSGICPSANFPYIFIFSGKSGHQHGYKDGWDNPSIFTYTGEGQAGDMKFTKGNLALKDHIKNGKRVFLFESETKGFVKFIAELILYDVDYFDTHDTSGQIRIGIKFFFNKRGSTIPVLADQLQQTTMSFAADIVEKELFVMPNVTERKGLVTSRVGQGAYRKRIIHRWEYKCAVTGFNKLDILIASHILPWADANDNERLDVDNGILLSPTFDALFDKHFISFDKQGKILLDHQIDEKAFNKIGVTGKEKLSKISDSNLIYLEKHQEKFYKNSGLEFPF